MTCKSKHPETGVQCDRVEGHAGNHTACAELVWSDPKQTPTNPFAVGNVVWSVIVGRPAVVTKVLNSNDLAVDVLYSNGVNVSTVWHVDMYGKTDVTLITSNRIPEGYELTGEYRKPVAGDIVLTVSGESMDVSSHSTFTRAEGLNPDRRLVLRKIRTYRPFKDPAEAYPLVKMMIRSKVTRKKHGWVCGPHLIMVCVDDGDYAHTDCQNGDRIRKFRSYDMQHMFDQFEQMDGTPFGVLE